MWHRILVTIIAVVGLCSVAGAQPPVKNVIWVIGDGMGPEVLGFFMQGTRYANLPNRVNLMSHTQQLMNQGVLGLFFNNTYDTIVTDSAAAATQMATGKFSRPGFIGMDYNKQSAQTFLELARKHNKAIGIISDAYVTDATPAAFTAHVQNRSQRKEIARQQITFAPEVILGGGAQYFEQGKNKDLLRDAEKQGYKVVRTKKQLEQVEDGKVLGLFADKGMPYAIEMKQYPKLPTLTDMTRQALMLLQKDEDGFVLMVEAGKIDWAAHANDAGSVWAEMKNFDRLIGYLQQYVQEHPDTLLYVNADHDTGLGSFVYRHVGSEKAAQKTAQGEVLYGGDTDYGSFGTYHLFEKQQRTLSEVYEELKQLPPQKRSGDVLWKKLSQALGYEVKPEDFTNPQDLEGVFRQLNTQRSMAYATQSHSAAPLISIAYGPGAESFGGVYHNTDIFPRLVALLGWTEK